jgi:deazaflavin-dependent oxidoreductase (nitroreductase family)
MDSDTHSGPLHQLNRWLYRGDQPNRLARLMNRASVALSSTGLVMPNRLMTLEVRGRRTGRTVRLPVVVADLDGSRYLVSMLGEDTNWVRNVRAANGQAALRHGHRETVHLEEVDPDARAPVLRRYLAVAPGARAHMPVDRHAPVSESERIADRYPVFRITANLSRT